MDRSPPILRIDLAGEVPVYRQLVEQLREKLVRGEFAVGDQLPTVRQLASDLGVHHNTVAEAYRMLAEEGWLELRRRLGARVIVRTNPRPQPHAPADFARRLGELIAAARARGLEPAALARALRAAADELDRGARQ